MTHRARRIGTSYWTLCALVSLTVAALPAAHAFGPYEEGDLPPDQRAPHGSMSMDAQERLLDRLLGDADVTIAPDGFDPWVWSVVVPRDNAMSVARVALGRKLYFDPRLSADNTVACATCHDVSRGFTDQRDRSEGIGGQLGTRNSPTTMNAMLYDTLFLDGRVDSLEKQAGFPPINPVEGGHPTRGAVVAAIAGDPEYRRLFQEAYNREPNAEDMERALGAFQRRLVFLSSPFDRYLAGDESAISAQAKRGWVLYNGKGRCMSCHMLSRTNLLGTDNQFHNIGVAARTQNFEVLASQALRALAQDGGDEAVDRLALETPLGELGRFLVTKDRADIGAFKTQGIRNVGITAPYMHDGSMRTLWDVMDHYNKGGEPNPFLDGGIEPLALTEEEIDDLVAFMFTMTDERFAEQNQQELETQRQIASRERPFRDDDMAMRRVLPFERRVTGRTQGRSER